MTITEAFGTFTPTSITVVATMICVSPRHKTLHLEILVGGFHLAMHNADLVLGAGKSRLSAS
jgi:hypothetical protein